MQILVFEKIGDNSQSSEAIKTRDFTVLAAKHMRIKDLKIIKSEEELFKNCSLKDLNDRNALILKDEVGIVGAIFISGTTRIAVKGIASEEEASQFFAYAEKIYPSASNALTNSPEKSSPTNLSVSGEENLSDSDFFVPTSASKSVTKEKQDTNRNASTEEKNKLRKQRRNGTKK
ncbi:MAG: hypothetical protein H0X29_01005 [Parachlamydiaceae bacterium]|nr:hypothetical protein [Parachlamydiaceae bacterium]